MSKASDTMLIFTEGQEEQALRGGLGRLATAVDVPIDTLRQGLSAFLRGVESIISESPARVGPYEVETIEISAQIDGTGRIGFLGTGAEFTAGASIRFLLKRSNS